MMKKGFTLVELSIVLVVIGLLIGGILVAQSMIGTSKVVAVAAQIGQFDAGVMNFKTKYNYLPGDAPAFGGDGDGLVDPSPCTGWNNEITFVGGEPAMFWSEIFPENYTKPSCSAVSYSQITGSSKNSPIASIGKKN